tara:strand:+ start:72 stop:749 length:678 start_codon:yes stop_codon:yes gene_type:complete
MLKGFAYLRSTLLPLMETIQPTMTQSFILDILGESDRISLQSILIAAGDRVEVFWNKVISDCAEENLIADTEIDQGVYKKSGKGFKKGDPKPKKKKKNNTIQVGMKMKKGKKVPDIRQIDHFFKMMGLRIYMESKCNLNFDTEKIVASNKKVLELTKALKADKGVYFVPVLIDIPEEIRSVYSKEGIDIWGVSDLLNLFDAPFTTQEFVDFMRSEVRPVLLSKGL